MVYINFDTATRFSDKSPSLGEENTRKSIILIYQSHIYNVRIVNIYNSTAVNTVIWIMWL